MPAPPQRVSPRGCVLPRLQAPRHPPSAHSCTLVPVIPGHAPPSPMRANIPAVPGSPVPSARCRPGNVARCTSRRLFCALRANACGHGQLLSPPSPFGSLHPTARSRCAPVARIAGLPPSSCRQRMSPVVNCQGAHLPKSPAGRVSVESFVCGVRSPRHPVEPWGFEPQTSAVQRRRSPS